MGTHHVHSPCDEGDQCCKCHKEICEYHAEVGVSATQPEGNRVQRWWWLCGSKGMGSR